MLKKDITFENLDGDMITQTFYFNLNKAELVAMEMEGGEGGFQAAMQQIIDSKDGKAIMEQFRNIILKTVGYRHEDGIRFIKTQDYRDAFEESGAYSELFVSLVTDAEAGAQFINGVIPRNLAEKVAAMQNQPGVPQDYKRKELQTASPNERNVFDQNPSSVADLPDPQPAQPVQVPSVPEPEPTQVPQPEEPSPLWGAGAQLDNRHGDNPLPDPAEQYLHDPNAGLGLRRDQRQA